MVIVSVLAVITNETLFNAAEPSATTLDTEILFLHPVDRYFIDPDANSNIQKQRADIQ